MNGGASAFPGTALSETLAMPGGDEDKIRTLYLRTLSREPRADEIARWTAFVNAPRDAVVTAPPATAGAAPPTAKGTAKAGEKKPGKPPTTQPAIHRPLRRPFKVNARPRFSPAKAW